MKIDDKIRDRKIQYDINREAAKRPALSSSVMNVLWEKEYYLQIKAE